MSGPDTLMGLLVESEAIVAVNLTGVEEIEKEGHKKVKRMDVQVTNVIRGDKNLIDRIITIRTLHPLLAWRDPEQRRYLLFLEHLEGESNERAHYQIVGLTSGIMMIDPQGHLFWTKGEPLIPGSKKFYMDEAFTGLTIEEAREKIHGISSSGLSGGGPETLDELLAESETIMAVNLTGVEEDANQGYIKLKLKEAEVTDVIRGDTGMLGQKIVINTVASLSAWQNPEQRRYLFFMNRPEQNGGVLPEYKITGEVMGILMVDAQGLLFYTTVEPLYPNSKKFYMDEAFTGLTLEEARDKINEILDRK